MGMQELDVEEYEAEEDEASIIEDSLEEGAEDILDVPEYLEEGDEMEDDPSDNAHGENPPYPWKKRATCKAKGSHTCEARGKRWASASRPVTVTLAIWRTSL